MLVKKAKLIKTFQKKKKKKKTKQTKTQKKTQKKLTDVHLSFTVNNNLP